MGVSQAVGRGNVGVSGPSGDTGGKIQGEGIH